MIRLSNECLTEELIGALCVCDSERPGCTHVPLRETPDAAYTSIGETQTRYVQPQIQHADIVISSICLAVPIPVPGRPMPGACQQILGLKKSMPSSRILSRSLLNLQSRCFNSCPARFTSATQEAGELSTVDGGLE